MLPVDLELGESIQSTSTSASNSLLESVRRDNSLASKDDSLFQETSEVGSVQFGVYASYWKAIGHILSLTVFCSIIFMQISRNLTDWWLAHWVTNQGGNSTGPNSTNLSLDVQYTVLMSDAFKSDDSDVYSYLKIYVELACVNTVFTLIRAFLFAYGGVQAATKVHKSLLKSVVKVKIIICVYNVIIIYL